jgi:transglutaminase-like putative cysteine protease
VIAHPMAHRHKEGKSRRRATRLSALCAFLFCYRSRLRNEIVADAFLTVGGSGSMKLKVRSDLLYDFPAGTEAIISIQAAASPDQQILFENLVISPNAQIVQDQPDERGERRFRAVFSGETRIVYEAVVDNGSRILLPADVPQRAWCDLPQGVLPYLTASRYCPSDRFFAFANREFGSIMDGGARVHAVLDWIHANVDYIAGVSDSETTAERTFVDRAGVCRDFSHLGITLCRALNIPARAVSAYAWQLDPPDFHAVFEVYLGGGWWLVDPTRLASAPQRPAVPCLPSIRGRRRLPSR